MTARALILLLVVLNLGVATWWALRPAPVAAVAAAMPSAPALRLLSEVSERAGATHIAAPAMQAAAQAPIASIRCMTFGPFRNAATLSQATVWLRPQVQKLQVRQAPTSGRGWRVWLPPLADRDVAQAMATRITAAGFSDYYIVPTGDEANSIALGRYGNEQAAQQRVKALQAAGFPVQAAALGATVSWIDVTATTTLDADVARTQTRASQARPLDCAKLG